ncbi:hypothetical protein DFH09DRAFT_1096727 [Mycena vulgaris]|nr:hypothetical protein DFH09DRAFT_1096727 [Mycena vulgaris]
MSTSKPCDSHLLASNDLQQDIPAGCPTPQGSSVPPVLLKTHLPSILDACRTLDFLITFIIPASALIHRMDKPQSLPAPTSPDSLLALLSAAAILCQAEQRPSAWTFSMRKRSAAVAATGYLAAACVSTVIVDSAMSVMGGAPVRGAGHMRAGFALEAAGGLDSVHYLLALVFFEGPIWEAVREAKLGAWRLGFEEQEKSEERRVTLASYRHERQQKSTAAQELPLASSNSFSARIQLDVRRKYAFVLSISYEKRTHPAGEFNSP